MAEISQGYSYGHCHIWDSTRCCLCCGLFWSQLVLMSNALADALERPSTQSDKTVRIVKIKRNIQTGFISLDSRIFQLQLGVGAQAQTFTKVSSPGNGETVMEF